MYFKTTISTLSILILGACISDISEPVASLPSAEQQMFDQVKMMAGPNQNVQSARLREDDNCYWYSHVGPVETTELPLLTADGRPICGPVAPEEPAV